MGDRKLVLTRASHIAPCGCAPRHCKTGVVGRCASCRKPGLALNAEHLCGRCWVTSFPCTCGAVTA